MCSAWTECLRLVDIFLAPALASIYQSSCLVISIRFNFGDSFSLLNAIQCRSIVLCHTAPSARFNRKMRKIFCSDSTANLP